MPWFEIAREVVSPIRLKIDTHLHREKQCALGYHDESCEERGMELKCQPFRVPDPDNHENLIVLYFCTHITWS